MQFLSLALYAFDRTRKKVVSTLSLSVSRCPSLCFCLCSTVRSRVRSSLFLFSTFFSTLRTGSASRQRNSCPRCLRPTALYAARAPRGIARQKLIEKTRRKAVRLWSRAIFNSTHSFICEMEGRGSISARGDEETRKLSARNALKISRTTVKSEAKVVFKIANVPTVGSGAYLRRSEW